MNVHVSPAIPPRTAFNGSTSEPPPAADPIFAAIENHRAAHAALLAALDADKEKEADRARSRANALAFTLLKLQPTTAAGITALLHYGYEFTEQGNEWPNWTDGAPFDWSARLNKVCADALDQIMSTDHCAAADPIFAAIYAHGRAEDQLKNKLKAIDLDLNPAEYRRARKPIDDLCAALTATVPTTPGGVAALLWYVWQNQQQDLSLSNDWLLASIKQRATDAFAQIKGA